MIDPKALKRETKYAKEHVDFINGLRPQEPATEAEAEEAFTKWALSIRDRRDLLANHVEHYFGGVLLIRADGEIVLCLTRELSEYERWSCSEFAVRARFCHCAYGIVCALWLAAREEQPFPAKRLLAQAQEAVREEAIACGAQVAVGVATVLDGPAWGMQVTAAQINSQIALVPRMAALLETESKNAAFLSELPGATSLALEELGGAAIGRRELVTRTARLLTDTAPRWTSRRSVKHTGTSDGTAPERAGSVDVYKEVETLELFHWVRDRLGSTDQELYDLCSRRLSDEAIGERLGMTANAVRKRSERLERTVRRLMDDFNKP